MIYGLPNGQRQRAPRWKTRVGGRRPAYNVPGDEFPGLDFVLPPSANDDRFHGNVTLEAGDDVGGLLFLVPTDGGVEQQDGDDDAKVDPVAKACGDEDGDLHDLGAWQISNGTADVRPERVPYRRGWGPGSRRGT
jgi:hypothetical protein